MYPLPDVCDGVLYSEEQIQDRVRALADAVSNDITSDRVVLVTVLRGGLLFLADFARYLDADCRLDFMSVSPYVHGVAGAVRVTKDLDEDIRGAEVVLVEDMVDTGLTINYVFSLLRAHGPASLRVCALFDKPARRIARVPIDYTGFECPDRFLVGYGLDLGGRWRNLPYVATVRDDEVWS